MAGRNAEPLDLSLAKLGFNTRPDHRRIEYSRATTPDQVRPCIFCRKETARAFLLRDVGAPSWIVHMICDWCYDEIQMMPRKVQLEQ